MKELNSCIWYKISVQYGQKLTLRKATIRRMLQRAGGRCEPVQDRIFPLFESVMKVTGVVSFIIRKRGRHFWRQYGWQRGSKTAFRPMCRNLLLEIEQRHRGRKAFCVEKKKGRGEHD